MSRRSGFTLIELTIVIVFAALLMTIVGRALGDVRGRIAADQAMKTFEAMHARARAHAVERATIARLILDTSGDSASVVRDGETVETVHFRSELGVDVTMTASSPLVLCMNSRGYGDDGCTSFKNIVLITFWAGSDTTALRMLPLGQIIR